MEETGVFNVDASRVDGNCFSNSKNGNRADANISSRVTSGDETDRETPAPVMCPKLRYDPTSTHYDMTGDRLMFIFNHETFLDSVHFEAQPKPRRGTDKDVSRLKTTFRNLKFKIDEPCNDYTHRQILKKLDNIRKLNHSTTSCLAIIILTHGKYNGMVLAADRAYPLSDVINAILHEPSLAGKPKLFFVQACRGGNVDTGHRIQIDGGRSSVIIPTHSDYLMMMSSFDEYTSFRSGSGSWMIQALCDVINEHSEDIMLNTVERREEDFLRMVTKVNKKVGENFSNSSVPNHNEKKQIPETRFTLTKVLNLFS